MMQTNEALTGAVERVTYYNAENGYSVVKVKPEGVTMLRAVARDGTVAVVGVMPELTAGETVRFTGAWINDPRYGMQFKAVTATPVPPSTEVGIVNYLGGGLVKGIGKRTAQKIVDHFGKDTLRILDRDPERLAEVKGFTAKKAAELARAWTENYSARQTMIYLQGFGVTGRMAARIFKFMGHETVQKVQDDPYILADEVNGIGFLRADAIALRMNLPRDSHNRLRAGLHYALNQLARDGHVYAPRTLLVNTAAEMLQVEDNELIQAALDAEIADGRLIVESVTRRDDQINAAVYLPEYYEAEAGAAARLRTLAESPSPITKTAKKLDWERFLKKLAAKSQLQLSEQQQQAVQAALTHKVSVLTGGPGTGKTTALKMVIEALQDRDFSFALASPTGRAAKRLSEATGCAASTLHRLLAFSPSEYAFLYDEDQPLDLDMVIVDEASMIDLLLFSDLLKALKPACHLMLVGDADQLPSVGAGNVLRDVIDSGAAHVTRLNFIFRQESGSYITVNAHRVNQGEQPLTDNQSRDFFFFTEEDPEAVARLVVDIVANRLPQRFLCDPVRDVQVIAPMYRGQAGVSALNELLQQALNRADPMRAEKALGARLFRAGDKVMQTRNNYDKDVFNGDIGYIVDIDHEERVFEVDIDGRSVFYEWSEAEELIHAYCISTHRSQGSEYPYVVMPILTQHYMMLQRNLLYTAITRAKKGVVLVGTRKALAIAVNNNDVARRYSGLLARLKHGSGALLARE